MAAVAVDYSFARPDPQALVDAGYTVVLRYLGTDSRCITRPELRRLHDVGLKVALIGQSTVTRPRAGYPAGVEDAHRYNDLAAGLDAPAWLPIFYVCDVGAGFPATSDYPAIRQYASGILATPGRPAGQYGPYPVLEMLRDLVVNGRRIVCWWQCAGGSGFGDGTGGSYHDPADIAGSRRRVSNLACMVQWVGGQRIQPTNATDHNAVLIEPVTWAWNPNETNPTEEDDDMAPPAIIWTKPGSAWARDVAGRAPGDEKAAYIFWPSGVITWIRTGEQLTEDVKLLEDRGETDDIWFYNGTFQPHDGRSKPVDVAAISSAVSTAISTHIATEGVKLGIDPAAVDQLVQRVTGGVGDVLAERLKA